MSSKVNRRSQSFSSKPCPLCGKVVFQLEKIIVGDHTFHESCFVCCVCQQRLTTGNYSEVDNKFYCPEHSTNLLREKQLCSEPAAGDDDSPQSALSSDNGCPLCRKAVIPGEGISLGDEDMVHKACFVCSECGAALTLGNFHALSDRLYCPTHFRQRKAEEGTGWSKPSSTHLDADPLQESLAALEDQEKQQAAAMNRARYITVPAQRTPPVDTPGDSHSTTPPASPPEPSPLAAAATAESEDAGKDQDNSRTLSQSETEDIEPSEDGLEKIEPRTRANDTEKDDAKRSGRRKRRDGKLNRNNSETETSGKAIRKRRKKSTEEVALDHTPKLQRSVSKLKRTKRSEKPDKSEKSEKSEKSVAEGEAAEDDKRKKPGKRGLFSLKKKNKKLTSSTSDVTKDAPGSPSLTSFVSSRFRKKPREDTPTATPTKATSAPPSKPRDRKPSQVIETEDDLSDDLDDLALEPLAENSPGQNRIGRLKQMDSPKKRTHDDGPSRFTPLSASKFKAPEPTPPKSVPISLEAPVSVTPSSVLELGPVGTTPPEDLPIDALDLPKDSEKPNYQWSDYELVRDIPPMAIELPENVLPEPHDEKERIGQEGFFQPHVTTFGLVGVQRRVLELLALLNTTFPFTTRIAAATDISDTAYDILRERNGSLERLAFTELLQRSDVDWVVVGCTYNNMAEIISAAFAAGKNVFCEKPICFNTADFVKLKEAHAKSGKQFIGGSVWRKVPFYEEIRNILQTGFLGEIVSVEMNHLLEPSRSGRLMCDWTRQERYCCTLLFDTFCFELDVLNWLLGSLPARVSAFAGANIFLPKNKPATQEDLEPYLKWDTLPLDKSLASEHPFTTDRDVDDHHTIILEYRNKIRASCHINTNCAFPQKRILICGLKGTLEGDLQTGIIRFKLIGDHGPMNEIRVSPGDAHGGADQAMMEDLIESVALADCFQAEELFPSAITALGVEQAKKSGAVVNLEDQWKLLGL